MDHIGFLTLGLLAATSTKTASLRHFAKEMAALMVDKSHQEQPKVATRIGSEVTQTRETNSSTRSEQYCITQPTSTLTLTSSASEPSAASEAKPASQAPQIQTQTQTQTQSNTAPTVPPNPLLDQPGLDLFDVSHCSDPRYAQMVRGVAAYYQQRCHAILNFQQERCQAWAANHRQKCQESTQAAMLVVAWYIRDRIGRRRRRHKRSFRHALRNKNLLAAVSRSRGGRAGKGESVRKWVTGIPEVALSPSNGMRDDGKLDPEERDFDVEKTVPKDKESQLFAVADQMIRSQLAKIDLPLLGALNLEDSECESDSDDDIRYMPEDCDMGDDDEDGEE